MAETLSTNFGTESGKNSAPIFVFASTRKKKIGRVLHPFAMHTFLAVSHGGPYLRGQEGPNGHSSAPTATVTPWAAAAMENQVRLTHFVRL